jgi:hypothetical protein
VPIRFSPDYDVASFVPKLFMSFSIAGARVRLKLIENFRPWDAEPVKS